MEFHQFILSVCAGVFLVSCDESVPKSYQYTEITVKPKVTQDTAPFMNMAASDPGVKAMLDKSISSIALAWDTPPGWSETKGEGLRMATLKTAGQGPIECSIVSLGGMVGGQEANIARWLKQINIEISAYELSEFLQKKTSLKTRGGLNAEVYDFTQLQSNQNTQAPSMTAAIIDVNDTSVFIKMTGTRDAVKNHFQEFKSLVNSLRRNNE